MDNNLDTLGVKKSLEMFSSQIINSYSQAMNFNAPISDFEAVAISGMGGSSNAAKIIQSVLEMDQKKQIFVFNDYNLPGWVNNKTLVILNSYSGNTEETLSALVDARLNGCQVVGISTSGKILKMVEAGEIYGLTIDVKDTNPTGFPKTGLGVSLGALIGVLTKLGVMNLSIDDLGKILTDLESVVGSQNVSEIANSIHGYLPVLLGGRPFIGALNAGRNAICEIGRTFSEFYDFPELNHVLIEATQKPEIVKSKRYIFFESNFNHPRVLLRYKITKRIFDEQGLSYQTVTLKSSTKLGQALEIYLISSWIGYYISTLDNVDPGPEPWILKLKDLLSQDPL